MKVLPEDVNSYLAPAKRGQNFQPVQAFDESPLTQIGFTTGGNPDLPCPTCEIKLENGKDNPECLAKKVTFNGETKLIEKFFIKTGIDGLMFDPWNSMTEGTQNRFSKLYGKPLWNFVETNKRSFDFYIKFLQTRNSAWKHNAERENFNG